MVERLRWSREGRDWPFRETSRFVFAAGLRWHVQQFGAGPLMLLLHGTGAASHSWRTLAPLLAAEHTLVIVDLPGHGFSSPAPSAQMSLPGMARALADLLKAIGVEPKAIVGHSAGAAVAVRYVLDQPLPADSAAHGTAVVSLNGAFMPWGGVAGRLFSPAARLLAINPLATKLFAWRARDPAAVRRLILSTGSKLDAKSTAFYEMLVRSPGHVAGALAMMANWNLSALQNDLPRLAAPLTLVVGDNDKTVPPSQADVVAALVPGARVEHLPGLGHLAHEEAPERVAAVIRAAFASNSPLRPFEERIAPLVGEM